MIPTALSIHSHRDRGALSAKVCRVAFTLLQSFAASVVIVSDLCKPLMGQHLRRGSPRLLLCLEDSRRSFPVCRETAVTSVPFPDSGGPRLPLHRKIVGCRGSQIGQRSRFENRRIVSVTSWNSATGTKSSPRNCSSLRCVCASKRRSSSSSRRRNRAVPACPCRVDTDQNAATHGVFSRLAHSRRANEAIELQPADHALHSNDVAESNGECMCCDEVSCPYALQRGIDRRQQHRRLVTPFHARRKPRQCGRALRDCARWAIPDRRASSPTPGIHHLDQGPKNRDRARQRRHAPAVAANHRDRNCRCGLARSDCAPRSTSTKPSAPSATCANISE